MEKITSLHNMKNYSQTCADFSWNKQERFNFSKDIIDHWAEQEPSKLAMHWIDDNGKELKKTFRDISIASCKLCNVLDSLGVKRGDTVMLMLGRNPEWWEIVTACLRMGAVVSPGTTQLSSKDLEYRINATTATCFITDSDNAEKLDTVISHCPSIKSRVILDGQREGWTPYGQAMEQASVQFNTADTTGDEEALCYFTSGTTGNPKMCIHSHSYAMGHETTGKYWLDLSPDDLHWNISDTGWAKAAWSSYFGPWICGAALFVHHTAGFSAKKTLDFLQRYPITTLCGAPTIYRMLVLEDLTHYQFESLRHCVGAGEPLNPEIIEIWQRATGLTIRDGYGQTETVVLCGSFPCIEPRFGSMGKPAPGIELHVIDDDGNIVAPNTEGDIAVKVKPEPPLGLFKEYKNDPEKTSESFRGDWYLTGDRAYVDDDGYFWFVGRADDVILSAGYRIGPFEVENALIEHPAVAESAAVSSPDDTRGEVVKAFVVLKPGYTGSEALKRNLQEHVKKVTAPYKYPRKVEFVESLPKTVSGKIRRVDLRMRDRC